METHELIIKVCGMTDPANILDVINLPVDAIGLIFDTRSKRYIQSDFALPEIMKNSRVKRVGVFVDAEPDDIYEKNLIYDFDFIQLHGHESAHVCHQLQQDFKVIKAFGLHADFDFEILIDYLPFCDYFLFDRIHDNLGGTVQDFDWSILDGYRYQIPFFLSGGIGPHKMSALKAWSHPQCVGIDLNSRFEIAPGIKNVPLLKQFIHALRSR